MRSDDSDVPLATAPTARAADIASGIDTRIAGSSRSVFGHRLATGTRLGNRYRIVRAIGAGGMGEVYEAVDERLDRRVALKTLPRIDGEALLLFKREFRALADVQHPGLASLGELAADGDLWFLTMELVRGTDWVTYARSGGETSLRAALVGLGEAVSALHRNGRVHRDLKPSNVLVEPSGRVVVLDFGLVHDAEALDATRSVGDAVRGTPLYMAPEQAAGRATDGAVDRYAIGVMLYEALTGTLPIEGAILRVLLRKQSEVPKAPSAIASGVAPDLEQLCMALLAIDPAERPGAEAIVDVARGGASAGASPMSGAVARPSLRASRNAPFVGRELELEQLAQAFSDSRARPVSVVIEGESGLGKSTLARTFVASLRDSGAFVLTSRCLDRETVPFKVLDGAIDMLARRLERMPVAEARAFAPRARARADLLATFPVLKSVRAFAVDEESGSRADVAEQRRRAFEALRELVERIAAASPVVFVVDDLQWADPDSNVALEEMLLPRDGPPALWIFTTRSDGVKRVRTVSPEGDVRHLALAPLGVDAAESLAVALGCSERVAHAIAGEAGGHPMFVAELARTMSIDAGVATAHELTLDAAIVRRLATMPDAVRALVEVTSLASIPLPTPIAFRVLGVDPADGRRALAAGRDAALVRLADTAAEAIEPFHDRVRESVLEALDEARRVELHAKIAAAIEVSELAERRPDVLANHLLGAGRLADARVALVAAARIATAAAGFDAAVAAYERALALPSLDEDETAMLREEFGHALNHAGRIVEASEQLLRSSAHGDAASRERRTCEAGLIVLDAGDIGRGRAILEPVLDARGERWPTVGPVFWLKLVAMFVWAVVWSVRASRDPRFPRERSVDREAATLSGVLFDAAMRVTTFDFVVAFWFTLRCLRAAIRSGDASALGRSAGAMAGILAMGSLDVGRWARLLERCSESRPSDVELAVASLTFGGIVAFGAERSRAGVDRAADELDAIATVAPARFHMHRRVLRTFSVWAGVRSGNPSPFPAAVAGARDAERRRNPLDGLYLANWSLPAFLAEGSLDEAVRIASRARDAIPSTDRQPLRDLFDLLFDANVGFARGEPIDSLAPRLRAQLRSVLRVHVAATQLWCFVASVGLVAALRRHAPTKPWLDFARMLPDLDDIDPERRPQTFSYVGLFRSRVALATDGPEAAIALLRRLAEHEGRHELFGLRLFTLHSIGRLLGGEEGARLQRESEDEWRRRGVRDPRVFCCLFAPLPDDGPPPDPAPRV